MATTDILDVARFINIFRDLFTSRATAMLEWSDITVNGALSVQIHCDRKHSFRLLCIQPPNTRAPHVEFTLSRLDGRLIAQVVCPKRKDEWIVTLGDGQTPGVALLKNRIAENAPVSMQDATRFISKMADLVR